MEYIKHIAPENGYQFLNSTKLCMRSLKLEHVFGSNDQYIKPEDLFYDRTDDDFELNTLFVSKLSRLSQYRMKSQCTLYNVQFTVYIHMYVFFNFQNFYSINLHQFLCVKNSC